MKFLNNLDAIEAQLMDRMTRVPASGRLVRVYAHPLQQGFAACVCDFSSTHIVRLVVDLDGQRFDYEVRRALESTVASLIALARMRAATEA